MKNNRTFHLLSIAILLEMIFILSYCAPKQHCGSRSKNREMQKINRIQYR
jgi:hypothetical protein